jgi:hypothetical protein
MLHRSEQQETTVQINVNVREPQSTNATNVKTPEIHTYFGQLPAPWMTVMIPREKG